MMPATMCMSLLVSALFIGVEPDETPKEETPKPPVLRLRKDRADKANVEPKDGSVEELERMEEKGDAKDVAPEVSDRNIPSPDEEKKEPSELDKELLGELGQNLEAATEEEDPLLRAGRRMREAEEQLARQEASDSTIEIQNKILADLDELLKQQQSGNPPPKNQNKNQKKNQKNQQQTAQKNQQQQRQAKQRQQQSKQANDANDQAGPPRMGREEFGAPKEVKDVWGHLSELMREEMSQYAKEGFLEKYREMLEQYYSTIASEPRSRSE